MHFICFGEWKWQKLHWWGNDKKTRKYSFMLPEVTRTLARNITGEGWSESIRRWQWSAATTCKTNTFLSYCSLSSVPAITFVCNKRAEFNLQWFLLPNWADWYPLGLTLWYILIIKCSLAPGAPGNNWHSQVCSVT